MGLEPTTSTLRVRRATHCATPPLKYCLCSCIIQNCSSRHVCMKGLIRSLSCSNNTYITAKFFLTKVSITSALHRFDFYHHWHIPILCWIYNHFVYIVCLRYVLWVDVTVFEVSVGIADMINCAKLGELSVPQDNILTHNTSHTSMNIN